MPSHDGLGLDDEEGILPAVPGPTQRDPEHAIFWREPGERLRLGQGVDLLTQRHVLEQEVGARAAQRPKGVSTRFKAFMKAHADPGAALVSRAQAIRSLAIASPRAIENVEHVQMIRVFGEAQPRCAVRASAGSD
ncbi:MAG TPA: hypothetical protein VKM54_05790 [Myxococcota bacterium]|nr:hypothetical protein [Myxococcota bacterium]